MDLRLLRRDHPQPGVADLGLTHDDPYFQDCWGPLLTPWTSHVVGEAVRITANGDRMMTFDALCTRLNPERAHPTAVKDREIRARTVFGAMQEAARAGLGFVKWSDPGRGVFGIFRHVPLLGDADLRRLNDSQLFAHISAVQDINRRLVATGRRALQVPDWLTDRLRRSDPTARPPTPAVVEIGQARLRALPTPTVSL